MAAYSICGWQRESDIYGKLIELERRLNHYKSSGINPFPAAQETLSGIEKPCMNQRTYYQIGSGLILLTRRMV